MIYLRTGLPGSGKTLRTIEQGLQFKREGRRVFAMNVNGLDYAATGFEEWTKGLEAWQELPQGAVLIVDEVQAFLKPRGPQATPPDWIEALTRNRHYGIDLLLVTQDAMLIDAYVRRLVNYHEHLVRMDGGLNRSRVYATEGLMDITKAGVPSHAEFSLWSFPPPLFEVYTSAKAHTVRKRVPQALKFAAYGALVVLAAVWWIVSSFAGRIDEAEAAKPPTPEPVPIPVAAPIQPARGLFEREQRGPMTTAEWLQQHVPRVQGMPWSAPVYDGFRPEAPPRMFCMIGGRSGCACFTEQVTRIPMDDGVCRAIVKDGLYDPFLASSGLRAAS